MPSTTNRIQIYKKAGKNMDGAYIGQLDYGETQIQVFAETVQECNRLIAGIKDIIKPLKTKKI